MWSSRVAQVWVLVCHMTVVQATATILSSCDFPIFYKSISTTEQSYQEVPSSGTIIEFSPNQGVSVKISVDSLVLNPTTPQGPILQMEFTLVTNASQPALYYDLSNINGAPFTEYGVLLQPSSGPSLVFPTCLPVGCAANSTSCPTVYTDPDGVNTMVCESSTDLVLSLCTAMPHRRRFRQRRSSHAHGRYYGSRN
jgi:hypothetical protein